jgi:hypothetical protein
MRKILSFLILWSIAVTVHAQSWEVGASVGGTGYTGDLNPNNPVLLSGSNAGIIVKRNFNQYLSVRLGASYATISGADSVSSNPQFVNRNLSFKTQLREVSLIGELNFMKYIPSVTTNRWTPYVFAGGAYTAFNPQAVYNGQTYNLSVLHTEGQTQDYKNRTWAAVYGAGVKVNFTDTWNLIADIGYRHVFTDYLDDVSGVYAPVSSFPGGPTSVAFALADRGKTPGFPGTQRGDLRPHDTYLFLNLTLSYTFVTAKCYFQ